MKGSNTFGVTSVKHTRPGPDASRTVGSPSTDKTGDSLNVGGPTWEGFVSLESSQGPHAIFVLADHGETSPSSSFLQPLDTGPRGYGLSARVHRLTLGGTGTPTVVVGVTDTGNLTVDDKDLLSPRPLPDGSAHGTHGQPSVRDHIRLYDVSTRRLGTSSVDVSVTLRRVRVISLTSFSSPLSSPTSRRS